MSNYEITHENILESGKNLFLEKGYERANLREICRGAGITTGAFYRHFEDKESLFSALVNPVVEGIMERYDSAEEICLSHLSDGDLISMWEKSSDTAVVFVEYIYDNFQLFKLLLQCSDGTKYVDFTNWMTEKEIEANLKMFAMMEERNIEFNRLSSKELHMLIHSFFSCMFETVLHDYKRDEAISYICTIKSFYSAGWKKVLGF